MMHRNIAAAAHCTQGKRKAMEDIHGQFSIPCGCLDAQHPSTVWYVCDGHGGDFVAKMVADTSGLESVLTKNLKHETDGASRDTLVAGALRRSFADLDEACFNQSKCGSTVCLLMLDHQCKGGGVYCANCGDSRCVVVDAHTKDILWRSKDHSPTDPGEKNRIMEEGGVVFTFKGVARVMGSLSLSRAIGDHFLKAYIISEPDVTVLTDICQRSSKVCFMIASDGFWNNMHIEKDIKNINFYEDLKTLTERAVYQSSQGRFTDNITLLTITMHDDVQEDSN